MPLRCRAAAQAQTAARPDRFGGTMRWALPLAAAGWAWHMDDRDGLVQLAETWATAEVASEALKRGIHEGLASAAVFTHELAPGQRAALVAAPGGWSMAYVARF